MNRVRSGVLILGGVLTALLLMPGGVIAQEPTDRVGTITGRVLEADGRRPLGQVDVLLVGTGRRTVTDGRGRFRFEGVPAGERRLRVRHLGFRSRELAVQVPPDQILGLTIRLDPEPVAVEPLDVQVESEIRLGRLEDDGFYYRRELGFGHFFGPQYLTRWSGARLPSLLARTPGVRLQKRSPGSYILESHRCTRRGMGVVVDGIPWGGVLPDFPVAEIAAVEVYRGPSETAGTLYHGAGCGVILIWTWRGPNPFHENADGPISCPERLKRFRSHAC